MHIEKSRILLEQDKCLVLQPELVKLVGRSAALLFQQIHYWVSSKDNIGMTHKGQKWIYNSYEGWVKDLKTISKSTINRSIRILRNFDLILVEKLSSHKSNRTNWYTINYKKLDELLSPSNEENLTSQCKSINKLKNNHAILIQPSIQNDSFNNTKITNKKKLMNPNLSKGSDNNLAKLFNKQPIARQMIQIWNEIVDPEVQAELTKTRCQLMVAALKYKFNNCLNKWKNYCLQITSSDFLMGRTKSGFKIALDSALKFDFIRKIFEKHFGVKSSISLTNEEDLNLNKIDNLNDSQEIKKLRKEILKNVGSIIYHHWFSDCIIKDNSDNKVLTILARNKFYQDTIVNNYKTKLERALRKKIKVLVG